VPVGMNALRALVLHIIEFDAFASAAASVAFLTLLSSLAA